MIMAIKRHKSKTIKRNTKTMMIKRNTQTKQLGGTQKSW
jgi:hypothetical protein